MASIVDNEKDLIPFSRLLLNLSATITWGIIGSLIIIWKISIPSNSALVGFLLGFTTTLLVISPFIYHHNHNKILSDKETDPQKQLLASLKFAIVFVLITAVLSLLFATIHHQFLVVLK